MTGCVASQMKLQLMIKALDEFLWVVAASVMNIVHEVSPPLAPCYNLLVAQTRHLFLKKSLASFQASISYA